MAFGPTYFVISISAAVKKSSASNHFRTLTARHLHYLGDHLGIELKKLEKFKTIDFKEIYGKTTPSPSCSCSDRVSAFVMDDILLAGQISNSPNPGDYAIVGEVLRTEPYSMMLRKDDPQFKALVDKTVGGVMKSGEINAIYPSGLPTRSRRRAST